MQRGHDDLVPAGDALQDSCHGQGHAGVQPGGGLVGQEDEGVGEELAAEGKPSPLARGDAFG